MTESIPYELRIGVTGHRHLKDPVGVTDAVNGLLATIESTLEGATAHPRNAANRRRGWAARLDPVLVNLARLFWPSIPKSPGTTPPEKRTPLHWAVVSPLAKGADQIVAKCVLAKPNSSLEPVLPLPLAEYLKDFDDPADEAEFRRLYEEWSHQEIVVESAAGSENVDEGSDERNDAYFKSGTDVVERSEILIAVWDGQPAAGRGGTGDIVASALRRGRSLYWINAEDPGAPVMVLTPKPDDPNQDEKETKAPAFPLFDKSPLPTAARDISLNFHQLSAYNRDFACDDDRCRETKDRHEVRLRKHAAKAGLLPEQITPVVDGLLPYYAKADDLANRYQTLHRRAGMVLHGVAALAVTIAVGQLLFFPDHLWLIWFEVAAMLVAVALLRVGKAENWHRKWLLDRQLAEHMRSVQFMVVMGEPDPGSPGSPHSVLDETLPFYRGPEGWIVDVAARVEQATRRSVPRTKDLEALRGFMAEAWIDDQAKWHKKNAEKKRGALHQAHWAGLILFSVTLITAALHAAGVGHDDGAHGHGSVTWWALCITALTVALPAWGAAVHAVTGLREHERIATRSERMSSVLAGIAQEAREATDMAELSAIVARARRIMALENHEWLVSLSFRGLELPT